MKTTELSFGAHGELVDLTAAVVDFCHDAGSGLLNVFAPHSTLGLALIQIGDGSGEDVLAAIKRLLPRDIDYAHIEKYEGHGADNVVPVPSSSALALLFPS
jgi:thiamine phosphate synthase YjbQ (UPF0047 family)